MSLLDQSIAFGGGKVEGPLVAAMLGSIDRGHVLRLLAALAKQDGAALLAEVEKLDESAPDYGSVLDELLEAVQRIAVLQLVGGRTDDEEFAAVAPFAETATMVLLTMLDGGVLGLVLGIALHVTRPGNILANKVVFAIINVAVNIVRPIPFIIFIAAIGPLTRAVVGTTIGTDAATFAMIFMASFVFARLVEQNLVSIDPGVVEAARAMGASPLRIIRTVLVPEALAPLILGYTFLFVGVLDMSAMVGVIGGGGLGDFAIQYGYRQYDWAVTFAVVVIIVVIVQLVQWLGNTLARKALRR